MEVEELNEQLDQTVLDIFQVLEDLYEKQAELEQFLKDGFFSMARARYNIGVKRVTADQIVDADLTANRTIQMTTEIEDHVSDICKDGVEDDETAKDVFDNLQDLFTLCDGKDKINNDDNSDNKENGSGVRKRGTGIPTTDEDKKSGGDDKRKGEDKEKKIKLGNPITLFGVLVPQTLRSCQNSFEEAVKISVEVANKKYKLNVLKKKLIFLKDKKSKLSSLDDSSSCIENES